MRTRLFVFLVAAAALAAAAGPVVAGAGHTFHGRITGAEFTCGGEPTHPYEAVTGTWNLNASGSGAVITLDVFYDGSHHLAFGYPGGEATPTTDGLVADFGFATATVAGDAFTWTAPVGECTPDHPYDTVVYTGGATR